MVIKDAWEKIKRPNDIGLLTPPGIERLNRYKRFSACKNEHKVDVDTTQFPMYYFALQSIKVKVCISLTSTACHYEGNVVTAFNNCYIDRGDLCAFFLFA